MAESVTNTRTGNQTAYVTNLYFTVRSLIGLTSIVIILDYSFGDGDIFMEQNPDPTCYIIAHDK